MHADNQDWIWFKARTVSKRLSGSIISLSGGSARPPSSVGVLRRSIQGGQGQDPREGGCRRERLPRLAHSYEFLARLHDEDARRPIWSAQSEERWLGGCLAPAGIRRGQRHRAYDK